MRKHGELLALILIITIIGVAIMLANPQDVKLSRHRPAGEARSSYRVIPEGYKALHDTLDALGFTTRRQVRPYRLLPARGLLIAVDPVAKTMTPYDRRCLLDWLRKGNHALILLENHPEFVAGFRDIPNGAFKANAPPPPMESWGMMVAGGRSTAKAVTSSFLSARAPELVVDAHFRFPEGAYLAKEVRTHVDGAVPLYRDAQGITTIYTAVGEGGIVWCCSPWSFSNAGLREGKNLDFLLTLVDLQPKAPIIFDEYHQGYGAGISVWTLAPKMTKLGLAQLGLAVVLLLLTIGWRFGPSRLPAEERFTRSRAEYLTSMAGLLERARATHVVRDRLSVMLRRELGRRLAVPPQARIERFLEANAQQNAVEHATLERVLRHLLMLENQHRPDPDALWRLAAEVHRMLHKHAGK